jgi:hypothetical protein
VANTLYPKAREAHLNGDISWRDDDIRAILVDLADYTYSTAHDFLDDIPLAARVATSGSLTSKTSTDGTAKAANVVFGLVTGDESEAVVLYQHTGTEATSRLIVYVDSATGLPVTPVGDDVTVAWDSAGIFTL